MKRILTILAAIVIALLMITGGFFASNANAWYEVTEAWKDFRNKQISGGIQVSVAHAPTWCPAERPIGVVIENTSSKDITQLELAVYAFSDNSSRAECMEYVDFQDEVFRSDGTAEWCISTIISSPLQVAEQTITREMMNYYDELIASSIPALPYNFSNKFGRDAEFIGDYLNSYARKYFDRAGDLNPKQSLGCREIQDQFQWNGRIDRFKVFEGFN